MTLILSLIYIAELVFFCYQDWRLGQTFRSSAWRWEIAGITIALVGLFARFGVAQWLQIAPCEVGPEWFIDSALLVGIITLGCFIISRHKLHTSLNMIFKRKPKDSTPPH